MLNFTELRPVGMPIGCIVALHGRGVRGEDLAPLADAIALDGMRWIFPDGPMELPVIWGGRAWYEIPPHHPRGLLESRTLLFELIEWLERQKIPSRRIALAGFSQGAVMSLDVGVRYPRRIAGIVAMSGYLARPETLTAEKSPAASGLPILLTHGKNDEVLPVEGAREAEAALRAEGFSVRLREYLMGHEVIPEALSEIRKFINLIFETEPRNGRS
ncbi:MAG TPA: dienelactone hydrolase family protein [Nitrospiria bacterium]|nr:dienelactone hydrolase family protein [Nitrospiria bacterium]